MSKKRKSATAGLEEVDRTLYPTFCTTANSLSQLYTHATNHQKLSFQAGEHHALFFGCIHEIVSDLELYTGFVGHVCPAKEDSSSEPCPHQPFRSW